MTTNLAQVFLTDDEWQSTLENAFEHCVPRGRIAFETPSSSPTALF